MKWLFKKGALLAMLFVCVSVANLSSVEMIDTLFESEMESTFKYAAPLLNNGSTPPAEIPVNQIVGIVTAICGAVGIICRTIEKYIEKRRCRRQGLS